MRRILRSRQSLGKYRVEKLLARGGFAEVYRAFDTIEGLRVALKIPYAHLIDQDLLDGFRKEVRLTAQLDHPNILPVKNAAFIDTHFVIVLPLGERSLSDRLKSRMSFGLALDYTGQMLEGLAFAHRRRILHCDVKPDNFIVFSGNRLRLADFGIAKVVLHTVSASGSGTLGYMSPEQAMGKPSFRSDVFSLGLVLYRMFSGQLPQWPFERPYPGAEKLRANFHPEFVSLLKTGSAYYAPGASVTVMLEAILRDTGHLLPAAAALDGEYGYSGIFLGVPVVLGREGIRSIEVLDLTEDERAALQHSADAVREGVRSVSQFL